MQAYLQFLLNNSRLLTFGLVLALFSAYGQTFLISLYIPEIAGLFELNNTAISSIYASATLTSAFTLPWVGKYIDTWPLLRFSLGVLVGLAIALLILSLAHSIVIVFIGFWGMRLTGQALMGHTAVTTMARAFDADRGKAISIVNIGHPIGEAIFPLIIAILISTYGWRVPLQLSAVSLVVLVIPFTIWILQGTDPSLLFPGRAKAPSVQTGNQFVARPYRLMLKWSFWILLPGIIYLGAINTAIFFFQIPFGESRGWSVEWMAGSIAAFAMASAFGMFISGPIVDKFTARRLFPFFLLPYVIGLCVMASSDWPYIYPIALIFAGISNGFGSTINNAIYAEIYGTHAIGSVRSMFATIGLFATALGPITFGFLLDRSYSFEVILLGAAIIALAIMAWSWQIRKA